MFRWIQTGNKKMQSIDINNNQDPTAEKVTIYYFDDFAFDAQHDELKNIASNLVHKLEPQVAHLLRLFLASPDQVISKELIQQSLWPNTVVEQNSLYQILTKLRRVLNDSTKSPKCIKTVPKKGYRFIANVSTELPKPLADIIPTTKNEKSLNQPSTRWMWLLPVIIVCFSAYAFFNSDEPEIKVPLYHLEDVSYALGLEFDVDAHPHADLLAYIKDIKTLTISNKQGTVLFQQPSTYRAAKPSWQKEGKLLAYWQYREDQCDLKIITPQGAIAHNGPAISCELAQKPVWKNSKELILTIKQHGTLVPYLYRLTNNALIPLPLKLPQNSIYKGALNAWNDKTYYLLNHKDHTSSLIELSGRTVLNWDFPIWLATFDPQQQTIVSNDVSQRHGLIATRLDKTHYPIFSTAQGLFSSISIDHAGDMYTAIESWQVNIRDKDNLPIFSTSSIDYLPVSNALGETAFMSRRSGICEVYLHSENNVTRLSQHKGYEYVQFLEWRPDLSMLVSNRDMDIALYDRQGMVQQFTSALDQSIKNLGWYNADTLYAFDGKTVHLYNLQGRLLSSISLDAQLAYYNVYNSSWLILKNNQLFNLTELTNNMFFGNKLTDKQLANSVTLTNKQVNQFHNIRIKNNNLYWQSSWSKHDHIWQLNLATQQITKVAKGNLIWHFDINANEELTIAKMEALEGDIKRLTTVN